MRATVADPSYRTLVSVVILAAGRGSRMRSDLPKVLHPVGGAPMLAHVVAAAEAIDAARVVTVVGHGGEAVAAAAQAASRDAVAIARQEAQLGTGHAVAQARAALAETSGDLLVLYGDTPLIRSETLTAMRAARGSATGVVVLGFRPTDPTGYGRLVLDADGRLDRIVEHKDANDAERAIGLCNSGVMLIDGDAAFGWLDRIDADNAKGEYYLTDVVAIARSDGRAAEVVEADAEEVLGVNTRGELALAEAAFQRRARAVAMDAGAHLIAPETVFFSADTQLAPDVTVEPNVVFGPGVVVASGARIRAFSHLEGATVGPEAVVGPYARLRPGAELGRDARVGNFVEVKNAVIGDGAKANHLTYLGDATVGAEANIGAGTITCNYDGYMKHVTHIGAQAFVGSNTALVAPVSVGAGATVAAGSTITESVPDDALAVARARQTVKPGLAKRLRAALAAAKAALVERT